MQAWLQIHMLRKEAEELVYMLQAASKGYRMCPIVAMIMQGA